LAHLFDPQEILIRVQATSINPVDWKTREGYNKKRRNLDFPYSQIMLNFFQRQFAIVNKTGFAFSA
jgi:hypothetical protein